MLQEDSWITRVASSGINTTNTHQLFPLQPEQVNLSKERYEEYLATLDKVGAYHAGHNNGRFSFAIERWGFAGSGWGIAVVSRDTAPTNQVVSLDDFRNSSSHEAYRHLDGSWYLWIRVSSR